MRRFFRLMYINCLNRFRFLAEVIADLQKIYYFCNLSTINQEGKKETRQFTPFFSSTFWGLTICDAHFSIWKLSKFIFMGSSFWPILVCKKAEFWRWKLWDQNFVPFDLRKIHIKESKKTGFTSKKQIFLISWFSILR